MEDENVAKGEGMRVGVGTRLVDAYLYFIAWYGS